MEGKEISVRECVWKGGDVYGEGGIVCGEGGRRGGGGSVGIPK